MIFVIPQLMTLATLQLACRTPAPSVLIPLALAQYEQRMAAAEPEDDTPEADRRPPVMPAGAEPRGATLYEKLEAQVPDPAAARTFVEAQLRLELTQSERQYYVEGMGYINQIDRPHKVELSLEDAVERTLYNSYAIRIQSYDPAISAAGVVQAESFFDALFFSNALWNKNNTPTASALQASDSNQTQFNTGIRKLLPTGMSVEAAWSVTRNEVDANFPFATLNPSYRNEMAFQLRQPVLQGFGLDYNRRQINIFKRRRDISEYQFSRAVMEQLLNAEEAYWRLVAARRDLVIASRLIADFQQVHDDLEARIEFDVSPVELKQAKARLDIQIADFANVRQRVKDAEDQLKSLMNDPQLNLAEDIEIVPIEFPSAEEIALDRLGELQAALDNRQELREAELAIEVAKINVGTAKNEALPRFDVTFSYVYDALGKSFYDSSRNLSDLDFHNYTVGLQFEWPIGNRGPRAAVRQARLEHAQALAQLKLQIEGILLEVNVAFRNLMTSYEQIGANLTSVESQIDEVQALEDRAERKDPAQLNVELDARQRLAGTRRRLLESLVTYNLAIARLERAKGTLLSYNNVTISDIQPPADAASELRPPPAP